MPTRATRDEGRLCRHLFRGARQRLPQRRKRIGPQTKEDQTANGQHDHEYGKGRRVGMKPVEACAAQRRPDADTQRENSKYRSVEFRIVSQPKIAAGEERHQVDLGADAEPTGYRAEKWRKPTGAAYQDADADHRYDKEDDRHIGTPEPVEAPAGKHPAKD